MNEFIVWDKKRKEWLHDEKHSIHLFGETIVFGEILRRKDDSHVRLEDLNNIEAFNYTGKTDIHGNKIYADSSIVEFIFMNGKKERGYFFFNKELLLYEIIPSLAPLNDINITSYCPNNITNLKVIGNLQKSPELLNKEER